MKKPIIFIPFWARDAVKQRGLPIESITQWGTISKLYSPSDMAAFLACQRYPLLQQLNPAADYALFDIWSQRSQAPLKALDATLEMAQQMSGSQAAQRFVEESLSGEPEGDACPVEIVSVGDDVTGVILLKGALTHLKDFNNHMPILKLILRDKMLGNKLSQVVQSDRMFFENLVRHAARSGGYRPPTPVF